MFKPYVGELASEIPLKDATVIGTRITLTLAHILRGRTLQDTKGLRKQLLGGHPMLEAIWEDEEVSVDDFPNYNLRTRLSLKE